MPADRLRRTAWHVLKALHRRLPWGERVVRLGQALLHDLAHPPLYPPGHFYSPLPSLSEVRAGAGRLFDLQQPLLGLDLREPAQRDLLARLEPFYADLPFAEQSGGPTRYYYQNDTFPQGDAILLTCLLRSLRPSRIIEVGSGYSSCLMLDVNERFFGDSIQLTFIDPYPQRLRALIRAGDEAKFKLVQTSVQAADLALFGALGPNDVLFVDSSHVCKTGSDLHHLLFQILPRLGPGVQVHFHDIYYPFEYPRESVMRGLAWNEAYVLRAFLCYNAAFRITLFTTYAAWKFEDWLRQHMPLCLKALGAALWIERTGGA